MNVHLPHPSSKKEVKGMYLNIYKNVFFGAFNNSIIFDIYDISHTLIQIKVLLFY